MTLNPDTATPETLRTFIAEKHREGRTLEYKARLPGRTDDDKREFLSDIVAFANTVGGLLVYGVSEQRDANGSNTGVPDSVCGLGEANCDQERLRLENLIADGVSPRIPGVRIRSVENVDATKGVMVVRVPKSWVAPHMVAFRNSSRFWARNSSGKYQLDIDEIRSAFQSSLAAADRIREFRAGRLSRILSGDTPISLAGAHFLVIHLLPLEALAPGFSVDLSPVEEMATNLQPIMASGWGGHYNFDGYYYKAPSPGETSYTLFFRNGCVEAVDTHILRDTEGEPMVPVGQGKSIPGVLLAKEVVRIAKNTFEAQTRLGLTPPVAVFLSLLNVRGYRLNAPVDAGRSTSTVDRDHLIIPDTLILERNVDMAEVLRPAFDAIWQATGRRRFSV